MSRQALSQTLVMVGGFAIHLFNGCLFLWGNIAPYVISYFYHFGGQTSLTMYDAVMVTPIMTCMLAIMNPTGAFLVRRFSPKVLIGVGVTIGCIAMLLSAYTQTFGAFIWCFAVMYGIGIGLCYFPPLACGWEWIPERKGLVTGIILGAFGFGAFVFSFVALAVINPENVQPVKQPDGNLIYAPDIAARVPTLMLVLAGCFAALGLTAVLLVRRNPTFVQQATVIVSDQLTVMEALKNKQLYLLFLVDILTIFPVFYLSSVYKTMGMQLGGFDDLFLTWIGSIGSVANGLSRIGWGSLQDKIGFSAIYKTVLVIELLVCSLLPYIVQTNKYLYLLWVFMGYLCLGAHFVIFPNVIVAKFGMRSSVQLSSLIYTTRAISTMSGLFISKALVKSYGEASYSIMFYTSCVFVVIAFIIETTCLSQEPIRKITPAEKERLLSETQNPQVSIST